MMSRATAGLANGKIVARSRDPKPPFAWPWNVCCCRSSDTCVQQANK